MESIKKMSRKEKFKYAKEQGIKCSATMTNAQLDHALGLSEPDTPAPKARKKKGDKKRIPLGQHRSKLSVDGYDIPKGKVARWVNDRGGRVQDALNGGYEFVQDPKKEADVGQDPLRHTGMGSAINIPVGSEDDGRPITGYLMVIDEELYNEDQEFKQAQQQELMDSIQKGTHQSQPHDGKYAPEGGTKIT